MQETPIGWTDFSVNLIKYCDVTGKIVWACVHASAGCIHCYAQTLALRWNKGKLFTAQNMEEVTPFFDEVEAKRILTSKKIAGKRVFVNDMTDWMGPWVDDEIIDSCFAVFALRRDVIFQTLTKHSDRQLKYFTAETSPHFYPCTRVEKLSYEMMRNSDVDVQVDTRWPLPNVHVGVSVEDQKNADNRIPRLLETDAAVRWVSAEPLLSAVNFEKISFKSYSTGTAFPATLLGGQKMVGVNGIVIGGESGPGHREMPLNSAIKLARAAQRAGVAVYFKQDSGPRPGKQGRVPDDIWALKEWPIQED